MHLPIGALAALLNLAFAADPLQYVCPRAAGPVRIDGKLGDAAWSRAPYTPFFVDIEGDAKPKPRFQTRAKMLWDDQYFYIAAELEEPHLWAVYREHDSVIFHQNDFEVFIDPGGDGLNYFEFEMNVLNTTWDLFLPKPYKDGGKADNGWEIPGLKSAVFASGTINNPRDRDRGWTLEIAFPWSAFNRGPRPPVKPKPGETWRVNFSRVEWKVDIRGNRYEKLLNTPEDNWVWSPQGVINMHVPEKWGFVRFVE